MAWNGDERSPYRMLDVFVSIKIRDSCIEAPVIVKIEMACTPSVVRVYICVYVYAFANVCPVAI